MAYPLSVPKELRLFIFAYIQCESLDSMFNYRWYVALTGTLVNYSSTSSVASLQRKTLRCAIIPHTTTLAMFGSGYVRLTPTCNTRSTSLALPTRFSLGLSRGLTSPGSLARWRQSPRKAEWESGRQRQTSGRQEIGEKLMPFFYCEDRTAPFLREPEQEWSVWWSDSLLLFYFLCLRLVSF